MAHITGSIRIEAPPERVFDTVADSRLEPSFNPAMTTVELLTPEPIGLGTRFRARMGNAGMEMLVELVEFDRPRRLGSRTTSPMMETTGTLTCTPEAGATRLSWDWQVLPKGWFRALGPLVGPVGRRMERRIWSGLKRELEGPTTSATGTTRHYQKAAEFKRDTENARIWLGLHFRKAMDDGNRVGRNSADYVFTHEFRTLG